MFKLTSIIALKGVGNIWLLISPMWIVMDGWSHELLAFLVPACLQHLLAIFLLGKGKRVSLEGEMMATLYSLLVISVGVVFLGILLFPLYFLMPSFNFNRTLSSITIGEVVTSIGLLILFFAEIYFLIKLENIANLAAKRWHEKYCS